MTKTNGLDVSGLTKYYFNTDFSQYWIDKTNWPVNFNLLAVTQGTLQNAPTNIPSLPLYNFTPNKNIVSKSPTSYTYTTSSPQIYPNYLGKGTLDCISLYDTSGNPISFIDIDNITHYVYILFSVEDLGGSTSGTNTSYSTTKTSVGNISTIYIQLSSYYFSSGSIIFNSFILDTSGNNLGTPQFSITSSLLSTPANGGAYNYTTISIYQSSVYNLNYSDLYLDGYCGIPLPPTPVTINTLSNQSATGNCIIVQSSTAENPFDFSNETAFYDNDSTSTYGSTYKYNNYYSNRVTTAPAVSNPVNKIYLPMLGTITFNLKPNRG
jgi:hypothetical protein